MAHTIGVFLVFVCFAAGILLVIHGHTHRVALTISLGILILVTTICIIPGSYIGIHHWRRKRAYRQEIRRTAMNAIKAQAIVQNHSLLIASPDNAQIVEA